MPRINNKAMACFKTIYIYLQFTLLSLPLLTLAIKPRGTTSAIINVSGGKGQGSQVPTAQLSVWCQATDDQGRVLPLKGATFKSKTQTHNAVITADKGNATLTLEKALATEAGKWQCDLHSDYGNSSRTFEVYVRPVIQQNLNVRVDDKDGSQFYLEITGTTTTVDQSVELHCPVYGYPTPSISWKKNNRIVSTATSSTMTLKIPTVTAADEGEYTCTASNSITTNGRPAQYTLLVDTHLRVKNKYAWITPAILIVVTLLLLGAIILFCDFRKRKSQPKPQDDD